MTSFIILGSGPSLNETNFDLIAASNINVIAVNNSWEKMPACGYVFSGDLEWWEKYHNKVPKTAELWTCNETASRKYRLQYLSSNGAFNSGLKSIELAIRFGAQNILLVGFDCSVKNGIHWHGHHKSLNNPDKFATAIWKRQFNRLARKTKEVNIVNCSVYTELNCFESISLDNGISRILNIK